MKIFEAESSPAPYADCCAVLLRGGRSRRMGADKASIPWKDGRTFLQAVAAQLDFLPEKYLSVAAGASGAEESKACGMAATSDAGLSLAWNKGAQHRRSESSIDIGSSASNSITQRNCGQSVEKHSELRKNLGIAPELSSDWIVLPDRVPDCGPMGGIWTALSACRAQWALVASCDIPAVQRPLFDLLLRELERENIDLIYPVTPDGRMHLTCALYRKTAAPVLEQQIRRGDCRLRSLLPLCSSRAVSVEDPLMVRMLSNVNTREDLRLLRRV